MDLIKVEPPDSPSSSRRVVGKIIQHGTLDQKSKLPRLFSVEWKKGPNTAVPEWQEYHSLKARCPKLLDKYLQDQQLGKYYANRPPMKKRMCTELAVRKAVTQPVRQVAPKSAKAEPQRRKLSPETHYVRRPSRSPSRSVSPSVSPEPVNLAPKHSSLRYTGTLQLSPGATFRSIPDPFDPKADLWVRQT